MSQICSPLLIEEYPMAPEYLREIWMEKTPEIHPALLEAVEIAIEAEVDILDWAAEANPEHDPDNYSCWKYEEYKQYMRDTFSYVPNSLWEWFNYDDMLLRFWAEDKYEIVYYDGTQLMLLEDVQPVQDNASQWFKDHEDKSKFFILQYGRPPVHPLL